MNPIDITNTMYIIKAMKVIQIHLDDSLHRALKLQALQVGQTMKEHIIMQLAAPYSKAELEGKSPLPRMRPLKEPIQPVVLKNNEQTKGFIKDLPGKLCKHNRAPGECLVEACENSKF